MIWFRSTVSGKGFNNLSFLAHHKGAEDQLDLKTIANEFIVKYDSRKLHFELGSF